MSGKLDQMREFMHKHFGWAVLFSELSHVFCCVIPTLVTVVSVFANAGLVAVAPDGPLMNIHNAIHEYEVPIIVASGVMVVLGWVAHLASARVDCHDTGCCHPPCTPQKSRNSRILLLATLLFAVNIMIYGVVHRNVFHLEMLNGAEEDHHHDEDHHHSSHGE